MLALTVRTSLNDPLYNQRKDTFAHLTMVKYCKRLKNMEMVMKYGKAGFLKYPSFPPKTLNVFKTAYPLITASFFIYFASKTKGKEKG